MKKLLLFIAVFGAPALLHGQNGEDAIETARQERKEIVKQARADRTKSSNQKNVALAAAPTDEEVGDSASFGKNAKFYGTVATGVVFIETDCSLLLPDLGPDDRCVEVADPTVITDVTFSDIGRITFPAKSADNIVYGLFNHNTSFFSRNGTAANVSGLINYFPSITLESEALNDPAAIDPATGLPMNGSYTTGGIGSKTSQKTLAPTFIELENLSYTRANTLGFSRAFWAALGLPDTVINKIYKKPLTIRLNLRVRTRFVEFGTINYSARFLAN